MPATPMPVRPSFWNELFTVSGRTNRGRWWLTVLLILGAYAVTAVAVLLVAVGSQNPALVALNLLPMLAAMVILVGSVVVSLLAGIRRLHDLDKSGHWLWLFYGVPALLHSIAQLLMHARFGNTPPADVLVVAIVVALAATGIGIWAFVEIACLPGTTGPNRFGPDPLPPPLLYGGAAALAGAIYSQPVPQPSAAPQASGLSSDARAILLFEANKKTPLVTYLLWVFLGMLGAHNFYLNRTGVGVAQLVLTLVLLFTVIGLLIPLVWIIVDAFLMPGWIRSHNNMLAAQLGAH